jgi:uncharacterized protein (TIRG00374 family)
MRGKRSRNAEVKWRKPGSRRTGGMGEMRVRRKSWIGRTARICLEIILLGLAGVMIVRAFEGVRFREFAAQIAPGIALGAIGIQAGLLGAATFRWGLFLREAGLWRGFGRAFRARISGFAIMYLTPAISFAGVPARATAYSDPSMDQERLYATIALDSFIEIAGKIPCIAIGLFCLMLLAHPSVPLIALAAGVMLALLTAGILLLVKLPAGGSLMLRFLKPLLRLLARAFPRRACRLLRSMRAFGRDMLSIAHRGRVVAVAVLVSVGIGMLEVMQAFFVLSLLGHASLPCACVVFSSVLLHGIIGILPGNIGGMEGTHILVFGLLGLGPGLAVVYTLVLRVGQMAMVCVGFANLCARRVSRSRKLRPGRIPDSCL